MYNKIKAVLICYLSGKFNYYQQKIYVKQDCKKNKSRFLFLC